MEQENPPTRASRSASASSKKSLTIDLSNLPPVSLPVPSNTLIFTNLQSRDIFQPDNLETIRNLITQTAPVHAFAPLRSFRRIIVSFFDEQAAVAVRSIWDGEAILGERCRVYFGQPTPTTNTQAHLALPDAGKLFFISPPPSPPHGWQMRLEDAPNKMVHAEDLADALAKLRHHDNARDGGLSPTSPADSKASDGIGSHQRSRSSTLIFQPQEHSPGLPCVTVEDMTDEPEYMEISTAKPVMAHTTRPPVELIHGA